MQVTADLKPRWVWIEGCFFLLTRSLRICDHLKLLSSRAGFEPLQQAQQELAVINQLTFGVTSYRKCLGEEKLETTVQEGGQGGAGVGLGKICRNGSPGALSLHCITRYY